MSQSRSRHALRYFVFIVSYLLHFQQAVFWARCAVAEPISYSGQVAPLLSNYCYECHGPDAAKREAGLRLDRLDTVINRAPETPGLESVIVPGAAAKSELARRLLSTDDERMPPPGHTRQPSADEVELLTRWIEAGAEWEEHWAFRPLRAHEIPSPADHEWPLNAIDRFVMRRLEAEGTTPAPDVDRRSLARRLYFDLIGLPPTPAELHAFEEDARPDAVERLVDSLLSSPRYGERWGRHWLDVARYGDSNGSDENHAYPHAFRYRDYVIAAFNFDLPYDRFVAEQIAGDLGDSKHIANQASERGFSALAATGYLAIGTKILAEQDPVKKQADMVDEQMDTFGRTFLGLTIGCARCHDHKFDPLTHHDYYALAGVFHSTRVSDRPLPSREAEMARLVFEEKRKELSLQLEAAQLRVAKEIATGDAIEREAEHFDAGNVAVDRESYGQGIGIVSDPGGQDNFVEYQFDLAEPGRYLLQLRYAAEASRAGKLIVNGELVNDHVMAETTGGWFPQHQQWFVEGTFELKTSRNSIRIETSPVMSHLDRLRLIRVDNQATTLAALAETTQIEDALAEHLKQEPTATLVMAAEEGEAKDVALHLRGSHESLGEIIPRGTPGFLSAAPIEVPRDSSGRDELATWMTSQPKVAALTARVAVNRIWKWHFGRGIVRTPDNFGLQGQPPTHPELLEYLAQRLMHGGWSVKRLHREIVTSHAYRLATEHADSSLAVRDPENRWLARAHRRRLEPEAIRDAMLQHSGRLDLRVGGAPPAVKSQDPSPEDMARNLRMYEDSRRRTVYLPVVRSNAYVFLTLFNFPNAATPVGRRDETIVPTQALMMLNSRYIHGLSQDVARVLLATTPEASVDARIGNLFLQLFARRPTADEVRACRLFLERAASENAANELASGISAWSSLAHTLLMSNDFVYLD